MYAEVVLSKVTPRLDKIYHYKVPAGLEVKVGHQVAIPFGKRATVGYVVGFKEKSDLPDDLIKEILEIRSPLPLFNTQALQLAKWLSEYYLSYFISALRCFMPPGQTQREKRKTRNNEPATDLIPHTPLPEPKKGLKLTEPQSEALKTILSSVREGKKETILLYGITGSGKTEVYMQAVAELLKLGQSSIILVPEISLTPQMIRLFRDRFSDHIALLHSSLTIKERDLEWKRIAQGEARIVLGTRSAVFAPAQDLGLIVMDEEYESTYKQEKSPRYHAREVARQMGVTVVLGSATPSIETYHNAKTGRYGMVHLPKRIDDRPLPEVEVVDMREEKRFMLSKRLREEIKATLEKGQKIILYMNRRGFFTFAQCRECGYVVECPRCAVALVYHTSDKKLRCGHCGYFAEAKIICPQCHNSSISFHGIGTQRIEKEVADIYPEARIVRLDRDALTARGSSDKAFAAFSEGGANVLIGTQLVTKGLDLAAVTLVGVVSADTSLNLPDFRAAEITFQQLTQVAGRAGRHHLPGKVIVQSYTPDHYAIRHASRHDYESFYNDEVKYRENLFYPPYSRLINLTVLSKIESESRKYAEQAARLLKDRGLPGILIQGPAASALIKIRGQYRYQILIKGVELSAVKQAIKKLTTPSNVRLSIDCDPMSLL